MQALQGVTERIARRNPEINAFATLNPGALDAARESTERWKAGQPRALEGVPVTVKDLIDVAGLPTRRGSKVTDPAPVAQDAPLVAALRQAGAVIIGKTTTTAFDWKSPVQPAAGITRTLERGQRRAAPPRLPRGASFLGRRMWAPMAAAPSAFPPLGAAL